MTAIEIDSLTKRYGDVTAVQDLDLSVSPGEVFGFLGPNGAGKSTTINVMLDFVRPTSGTVSILGHNPQTNPRAVRERIGVLPEATGFYGQDTARDHLRFAIAMKQTDDTPDLLLERVGIADEADRPVAGFSKGMRKRLGLAIALVGSPELLVLDEPLSGLDPSGARLLREVVRDERDRGAAVFFSSHIMDQVEMICDRIGIMHDGRLIAVDTIEAIRRSSTLPATLSLSVQAIPDGIVGELSKLEGVTDVSARDRSIVVDCREPSAKAAVVTRLEAAGVSVNDIETELPSLEQVFTSITDDRIPA